MAATPVDVINFYEAYFTQGDSLKRSLALAAEAAATDYLDGKPKRRGKHKVTAAQRDADFWSCAAWRALPAELWRSGLMTLARARYFVQEKITNVELLSRIAVACPAALSTAARRSRLALRPASAHRRGLESLAGLHGDIAELLPRTSHLRRSPPRARRGGNAAAARACGRDALRPARPGQPLRVRASRAGGHAFATASCW